MILLDTDHLTVLKYIDSDRCQKLLARIADAKDEQIGTTIVNVEEQMRGWLAAIAREKDLMRQIPAYRELADLFRYFDNFIIALFDELAVAEFHRFRRIKVRVGTMDLKIASIALTTQSLTANEGDFSRVPGLRMANWLV